MPPVHRCLGTYEGLSKIVGDYSPKAPGSVIPGGKITLNYICQGHMLAIQSQFVIVLFSVEAAVGKTKLDWVAVGARDR